MWSTSQLVRKYSALIHFNSRKE
uniref:Uncharacterized protein n=1 Tax=Anguilla anguilla TaxID=7936 RepID=A0A0E9UCW9_ANGAN